MNGQQSHVLISHAAFHQMVPCCICSASEIWSDIHIHKNVSVYFSLFQVFGYKGHTPNNNSIWSGTLNIAVFWSLTPCNIVGASWCIRGNCIHHQDGSYTLMETAGFSEMLVQVNHMTWCYNPEACDHQYTSSLQSFNGKKWISHELRMSMALL